MGKDRDIIVFFNWLQCVVTQYFLPPVRWKDVRVYDMKSTRFSGNDRNIGLLLRTIKFVTQLSIYSFMPHWSKYLDEKTSEALSSDDLDSSGTLYAIQTLQQNNFKKMITMFHKNVSDYRTIT